MARLAGVSVRALHHYDEIGLLRPTGRSEAGYRLYTDGDLLRLQQIVIGRELGLSLEDIRRSLDDPRFDHRRALLEQRAALQARLSQTSAMIAAVDKALAVLGGEAGATTEGGDAMEKVDMKEIFDGFDPKEHEAEAQQRWGHTDAFKESQQRTKRYGKNEWTQIKAEQGAIFDDAAKALAAGKRPTDDDVMDIADRHRLSIDRWFYPCSVVMHRGLADLWENDERFAANIDKYAAGLTPFLAAAVRANAARHGG